MSMKVRQLTLVVKNQEEALKFYTDRVGFAIKTDFTPEGLPRWVTVGPEEQEFEIALYQLGNEDPNGWSKDWKPGIYPPVVIQVDDCVSAYKVLKSKGVKFLQDKPAELPWGISATFEDPDRNLFSLVQFRHMQ